MRLFWLKITALAILLGILAVVWFGQIADQVQVRTQFGIYRVVIVYFAFIGLCLASLIVTPFLRPNLARVAISVFLIVGISADYIFHRVSGAVLNAPLVQMIWNVKESMFGIAIAAYYPTLMETAALLLPCAVILCWPPSITRSLSSRWAIVPIGTAAGILALTLYTKGGTSQFPVFSAVINTAIAATSSKYQGPRHAVAYKGSISRKIKKIVYIVDESVRSDYLSINDPAKATTPFLASKSDDIINFGTALAATNCSESTRYILRTGLQEKQLPDIKQMGLRIPSMWQYAKAAGYKTIYVDAYATSQNTAISNHSYMTMTERAAIDVSVPINSKPNYMRDRNLAREIRARLETDEPVFIFAEKLGAHFPYSLTYPPEYAGTEGPFPKAELTDRAELQKSYRLAIQWTVDEFFRTLLQGLDLRDILIIYTSDHGQSLLDGGYRISHCSTTGTIHPGEAWVPLVALTKNKPLNGQLRVAARIRFDRASHFEIFPSLLGFMGYHPEWVHEHYGGTLFNGPKERKQQFFTGHIFGAVQGYRWVAGRTTKH